MKKMINLPAFLLSSSLTALNFLAFTAPLQEANATKRADLEEDEWREQSSIFSDSIIRTDSSIANTVKIWNWSNISQSSEHISQEDQIHIKLSELLMENSALNDFLEYHNNTVVVDITPTEDERGPIHLNLSYRQIPNNLKHLSFFCNSNRDIIIGNYFLSGCSGLESLDLTPLRNVTTIGNHFLDNCDSLRSLDLSGLINVTTIGNNFLGDCKDLKSLDLSGLRNVTSIGNNFLYSCRGLTSVDLSGLINVTSIGNHFLHYCKDLKSLDLSGLINVTTIGDHFLYYCVGITSVDLSGLINVTAIEDDFLSNCYGLKSLDLSPLINVTTIESAFLMNCRGLRSLDLTPLRNVTTIGDLFLYNFRGLTSLDLSGFSNVTTIGDSFLDNCSDLEELNLRGSLVLADEIAQSRTIFNEGMKFVISEANIELWKKTLPWTKDSDFVFQTIAERKKAEIEMEMLEERLAFQFNYPVTNVITINGGYNLPTSFLSF